MAAVTAFHPTLFQPIQGNIFPKLNKEGGSSYYTFISGNQLGIEKSADHSSAKPTDLKAISAFVQTALKNGSGLAKELAGHAENEKIYLHLNLNNLSSLIVRHNQKVRDSFLVTFVHVLLLILTLGIFKYRDTLLIEKTAVSLKELGVDEIPFLEDSELYQLSSVFVFGMRKEDRDLFLEKAGLMEKWKAFLDKRPDLAAQAADPSLENSVLDEAVFRPLRLDVLRKAADFEKTPLALSLTEAQKKSKDQLGVMFEIFKILVPHLRSMSPTERRDAIFCLPKEARDETLELSKALQELEENRAAFDQILLQSQSGAQDPQIEGILMIARFTKEQSQMIQDLAQMIRDAHTPVK